MKSAVHHLAVLLIGLTFLTATTQAEVTFPSWVDKAYVVHHIQLMHRLHALVIPSVDWKNVSFVDALGDLASKSLAADPTHQGVHFIVPPGMLRARGLPVTFKGENVPFLDLLKKLDWLSYEVTDEDVKFVNLNWCETLAVRTFFIPTGYFKLHAEDVIPGSPGLYDVSSQLLALGISDSRTCGTYSPRLQKLKVVISSPQAWEEVDEDLYP